jgi:hypothetical protein
MRNAGKPECGQASGTNKSGRDWLLLSCISPVITGNSLPTTHVLANQRVTQKKTRRAVIPLARNRQQIKDLNRNLICEDKGLKYCGFRIADCGFQTSQVLAIRNPQSEIALPSNT